MEAVFILDFSADLVKAQMVINSLRKEASPFKKFLLMIIQGSVRMKGDQNGLGLFFCPGQDAVPVCEQ
jgi:hypothetical protein